MHTRYTIETEHQTLATASIVDEATDLAAEYTRRTSEPVMIYRERRECVWSSAVGSMVDRST